MPCPLGSARTELGPSRVERKIVGVLQPEALETRRRLFRALERVFPVHFEPRETGNLSGLDAVVAISSAPDEVELQLSTLPCLIVREVGEDVRRTEDASVELAATRAVDPRLRGRCFNDTSVVGHSALECGRADEVLASTSAGPTWVRQASEGPNLYVSSIPLGDLDREESIRDHFRFDRFSSLLPLVHLLDEVTHDSGWTPPPLRASFIIDDPNLHWPTYGYVHFQKLAHHAKKHRYHIAMATIPLDLWYFDRRVVRVFQGNPRQLSLVMHGNDHVRASSPGPGRRTKHMRFCSRRYGGSPRSSAGQDSRLRG